MRDHRRSYKDFYTNINRAKPGHCNNLRSLLCPCAGWQSCEKGKDCSFHAADGQPLVNASKFPDLGALVKYGDNKGVLVGWYQINCICCDEFTDKGNTSWKKKVYAADVKQLLDAGFHGVKLDDCGE